MGLMSFLLMGRAEKETSKRGLAKDHDPLRWWSGGGAAIKAILKKGQPGPGTGGWRLQADSVDAAMEPRVWALGMRAGKSQKPEQDHRGALFCGSDLLVLVRLHSDVILLKF